MPARPRSRPAGLRLLAASLLFVQSALPSPAAAAPDDDPYDRPGFYVGGSGIYTNNFFDDQVDDAFTDLIGAPVDVDIDDSFGANARIGYRAASWIGLEVQYEWVDNFETEITSPAFPGEKATIDLTGHSVTLNAKLVLPTWRIQPYLLLGAGYSLYDADTNVSAGLGAIPGVRTSGGKESGFAGRGGAGIDWYLTRHVVLNTEVTALLTTQDFDEPDTGSIDNLYYLSMGAGLQFRF